MSECGTIQDEGFRRLRFELAGGAMAGLAFGREGPNPDIVFLHATGFNARTYRAMLAPLGNRFQVWAIDLRGHGRTTLPARRFGYSSWRQHREDIANLLDRYTSGRVTLAGHSFGGTVALMVAARRPELVASLALIDPVILSSTHYGAVELPLAPLLMRATFPLARGAARRRARFPTRDAAVEAFTDRGVFKVFPREVIEDYVADGLREDAAGDFVLSCSPLYEAATFAAQRNNPWPLFRQVKCPLVALRAERHSTFVSSAAHRLALVKPDARIVTLEGAGHMIPMEQPDRVRAAIESAALMGGGARRRDVDQ